MIHYSSVYVEALWSWVLMPGKGHKQQQCRYTYPHTHTKKKISERSAGSRKIFPLRVFRNWVSPGKVLPFLCEGFPSGTTLRCMSLHGYKIQSSWQPCLKIVVIIPLVGTSKEFWGWGTRKECNLLAIMEHKSSGSASRYQCSWLFGLKD